MSIISYSTTISTSNDKSLVKKEVGPTKKVLEEEEYLDRMSKIIRRDFFSDIQFPNGSDTSTSYEESDRSERLYSGTPGTDRTCLSATSSIRSRREACSLSLDEYLEKYTSEDNAYFEKLQKKELRRHRTKYPWLYKDQSNHNRKVQEQLKLTSTKESKPVKSDTNSALMIDWPYNPTNSLFYPPPDRENLKRKNRTTINYHSNRFMNEPNFKEPYAPKVESRQQKSFKGFNDKIGIDGKLLNGSETPIINGYSFIPEPETPKINLGGTKIKTETNRFYIPSQSPREELAHKMYQEKVGKSIRTPKIGSDRTPSLQTPSSMRKSYSGFSFSPERIKGTTPIFKKK